jgi:hypothetical protein
MTTPRQSLRVSAAEPRTTVPSPAARGLLQRKCACGGGFSGTCEECAEKRKVQRRSTGAAAVRVPSAVHDAL